MAEIRLSLVIAVVTIAVYLPLVGWHRLQEYQTDKVWALVAVLAGVAAWCGWRDQLVAGVKAEAVVLTVLWSVDATTSATGGGDGMWLAGALFVFIGTYGGGVVVGLVADLAHGRFVRARRDDDRRG